MTKAEKRNLVISGLLGLAIGDAFGVPVEFLSRQEVRQIRLQEMVGNDCALPFSSNWGDRIPRGAWSDDTSMAVASMASVIRCHGQIDCTDIMRQFLAWWDEGKYTSLDYPFGLGRTVGQALDRFRSGVPAERCGGTGIRDNGNGALMRIFPFAMFCILNGLSDTETLNVIRKTSEITHGHEISVMSCYLYTQFLRVCLETKDPEIAFARVFRRTGYARVFSDEAVQAHTILLHNDFNDSFDPDQIPESGYVVDSLIISVYSVLKNDTYEGAVRMAVDFGYDTDTNAAITGSIAGAMYGMKQIPARWLCVLRKKEELLRIAERFADSVMHAT